MVDSIVILCCRCRLSQVKRKAAGAGTKATGAKSTQVAQDSEVIAKERKGGETAVVSDDELPSVPMSLPPLGVGFHLEDTIKEKIAQGRYVSFCTLLPTYRPTSKLVFNAERGISSVSSDKKLFNFSDWMDAFIIYAYVRAKAHPDEAIHLFHYQQTIKRIHDRGGNFIAYDEAFRCKHRGAVPIPWQGLDDAELSLGRHGHLLCPI